VLGRAVHSVAASAICGLLLVLYCPSIAIAQVPLVVPEDDSLQTFDLILRNSDDPDLLSTRQSVVRQSLLNMGVEPRQWRRPSLQTLLERRHNDRVGYDPFAPPRTVQFLEVDYAHDFVAVIEHSETMSFTSAADTNLVGIAFHEARDFSDSTVTVAVHGADAWTNAWVAVAVHDSWLRSVENYQSQGATDDGALNFRIPIKVPRSIERIIGRSEATQINISGTEQIRIGGQSTVRNDFVGNEIQQTQSLFPSLEMEQTLRVNLDGTIGERIRVRVTHNSAAGFGQPATEVKWEFVGDEDDIIQAIRAGNIDVTLPGSGLLGVAASRGGLFGLRVSGAVGPVSYTMFTSKEESQEGKATFNASGGTATPFSIRSVDYIKNKFFRLRAPTAQFFPPTDPIYDDLTDDSANWPAGWRIDHLSVEVYKSIFAQGQSGETITRGYAVLDTTGSGWTELSSADPAVRAAILSNVPEEHLEESREGWQLLEPERDWFPLLDGNGNTIGIALDVAIRENSNVALAVAYNIVDDTGAVVRKVGLRPNADLNPTVDAPDGSGEQVYVLKLIKPKIVASPRRVDGTAEPFALTWEYMFRNFYDLLASDLSEQTISLQIESRRNELEQPEFNDQGTEWVTVFELDREGDRGNTPDPDGRPDFHDPLLFNLQEGYVQFPYPTPFARIQPYEDDIAGSDQDQALFDGVLDIYQRVLTSQEPNELTYFDIVGEYTAISAVQRLPAFNIREGSEEVLLGGVKLSRGVDYTIDYFTGELTLTPIRAAQINAQSNLEVRYEVDPLFGGGRSSLHGISLSYALGNQKSIDTTLLMKNQPTAAKKPRLGEEPNQTLVGNLATKLRFTPYFLTRLANLLPLVSGRDESVVNVDAEIAMSMPNPNTKRFGYVEDFEGADENITISMSRGGWAWASFPAVADTNGAGRLYNQPSQRAFTRWHREQPSVKRAELNPELSEREREDIVQTLALKMISNDAVNNPANPIWQDNEYGGIMRGFPGEVDLSRSQFLEFWINDFAAGLPADQREGRIHFDFGYINEDYFWSPRDDGSFELGGDDSEDDPPFNNRLDGLEDRGLDRVWSNPDNREPGEAEYQNHPLLPGLPKPTGADEPSYTDTGGDDYLANEFIDELVVKNDADNPIRNDPVLKDEQYLYINGTEGNNQFDTEDLNRDSVFGKADGYYSLVLDLSNEDDVIVNVNDEFGSQFGDDLLDPNDKGNSWRKYRLDLRALQQITPPADPQLSHLRSAAPDLSRVTHFRIWYENPDGIQRSAKTKLLFSEMRFLGNRWLSDGLRDSLDFALDPAERGPFEDFRVGVLNNKENPDYRPPVTPEERNNISEKEQALQLVYTDLEEGHGGRVRQQVVGGVKQDLLLYGVLEYFWRAPYDGDTRDASQDSLEAFYWVGSDSTNYYEIALRFAEMQLDDNWQQCRIDLGELTNVKFTEIDTVSTNPVVAYRRGTIQDVKTGERYRVRVRGRPDLRSVARYYAGVRNPTGSQMGPVTGNVLFNEVRLSQVDDKIGYAGRIAMNANIKGLGDIGFDFNQRDEDFRSLNDRVGSNVRERNWSARASTSVQRLIPTFGLEIPVSGNIRRSSRLPRYRTNSDIELLTLEAREAEETTSRTESFNFQVRKSSPSERWWLQYTVDRLNFSMSASRSQNDSPLNASRRKSADRRFAYDLRFPAAGHELTVPLVGWNVRYLPNQISAESNWTFDQNRTATKRSTGGPASPREIIWKAPQTTKSNRNAVTFGQSLAQNLRLTFTMNETRDLTRRNEETGQADPVEFLGLFDVGHQDQYAQSWTINYTSELPVLRWFDPDLSYNARYSEDRKPGVRQRDPLDETTLLGEAGKVRNVQNSGNFTANGRVDLTSWFVDRLREWGRDDDPDEQDQEERSPPTPPTPQDRRAESVPNLIPGSVADGEAAADSTAAESDSLQVADAGPKLNPVKEFGKLFSPVKRLFTDLDPFNINFTLNRGSNFRHVNQRAPFGYRFGLTIDDDPADVGFTEQIREDIPLASSTGSRQETNLTLSTRSKLGDNTSVDTSFNERRNLRKNSSSPGNESFSRSFPQFGLHFNNMQRFRLLKGWLQSSSVDLTYKKTEDWQAALNATRFPKTTWSLLPRWSMGFFNGLNATLNVTYNSDYQENTANIIRGNSLTVGVNMVKSFDAQGRLSFLRFGREGFGSTIDMTLDINYSQRKNVTESRSGATVNRFSQATGQRRISVNPKFQYQFSRNLRGGIDLQYSRTVETERVLPSGENPVIQSFGMFFDATLNF